MTSGRLRVRMLGTGTSHGVPMIGCRCAVCRSDDPRDRRWRPSILIETPDGTAILVDTATDLRAQALAFDVTRVDAILFTHSHADHLMGLDEVRRFNVLQRAAIPCYADARTAADIRRTFAYVFEPGPAGGGIPQIDLHEIDGPLVLGGVQVVPVPVLHGARPIYGYRIGPFAYLTDCNAIPDASWALLDGVTDLVLDALRDRPHPTHFTVAEALDVVTRLRPQRTWFTHICHDLPHQATCERLPDGVNLAYDGLTVEMALDLPSAGAPSRAR
ncbi:MAG TPA: MBL fold metallo-hydrolase [Vicinamibacterales bacterium]|nr:MBL fold metallo-hydrolase [Vicinamibacterales bacterium]